MMTADHGHADTSDDDDLARRAALLAQVGHPVDAPPRALAVDRLAELGWAS